jgi:hypothetical protein
MTTSPQARWLRWGLLPFKAFALLALPLIPLADSAGMPWIPSLDLGLDMLVGWLCLLCSLVLVVAAVVQKFIGPVGAAWRTLCFAVLAFIVGAFLSPLFVIA